MHEYWSAGIVRSKMRTVFRNQSSRKTLRFEHQIISKEKLYEYYLHCFAPNRGYCIYFATRGKKRFTNNFFVFCVGCFLWSNLWYDFINNKKKFPSSVTATKRHKTLSHLELDFNRSLNVVDVKFKIGEYYSEWYLRILPCFSCGMFGRVECLDQSHAMKNIWWILNINIHYQHLKANMSLKENLKFFECNYP